MAGDKKQKQTVLMLEDACEIGQRKTPAIRAHQKRSPMKQISESIIKSTKSVLGGWTKVTTLGCMLALVFLVAASVRSQSSGKARPFKEVGIISLTPDASGLGGTFGVVGTATHLGAFVGQGTYEVTGVSSDGLKVFMHVAATWTADNGDSIMLEIPTWVNDYSVTPPIARRQFMKGF